MTPLKDRVSVMG